MTIMPQHQQIDGLRFMERSIKRSCARADIPAMALHMPASYIAPCTHTSCHATLPSVLHTAYTCIAHTFHCCLCTHTSFHISPFFCILPAPALYTTPVCSACYPHMPSLCLPPLLTTYLPSCPVRLWRRRAARQHTAIGDEDDRGGVVAMRMTCAHNACALSAKAS